MAIFVFIMGWGLFFCEWAHKNKTIEIGSGQKRGIFDSSGAFRGVTFPQVKTKLIIFYLFKQNKYVTQSSAWGWVPTWNAAPNIFSKNGWFCLRLETCLHCPSPIGCWINNSPLLSLTGRSSRGVNYVEIRDFIFNVMC